MSNPVTAREQMKGSPLFQMLETKMLSCQGQNGELNLAELSRKIGFSKQNLHWSLGKDFLTAATAYYLLERCSDELTIRDIRPFVRRNRTGR